MKFKVAPILLAAGKSQRFGSPKALAKFGKRTALELAIHAAQKAGDLPVRVVVGDPAPEVLDLLRKEGAHAVSNPAFTAGQTSSVQAGIRAVTEKVAGYAVFLVDQPLVRAETVSALAKEFTLHYDRVIRPLFGGRGGHPTFIPSALREEILALDPSKSLRELLLREGRVMDVAVEDPGVRADFNTQEDYRKLLKLLSESR